MRSIQADWSVLSGGSNQWTFASGAVNGHSTSGDSILASRKEYGDVTFSAMARTPDREASLAIRMQDANNGYLIVFAPSGTAILPQAGYISVVKRTDGNEATLATYRGRKIPVASQTVKITAIARGSLIEVQLNGVKILQTEDETSAAGKIGFRIYGDPTFPCDATFSKVTFH